MIAVASLLRGPDVPDDFPGREGLYGGDEDWMCPGWSAIVDPTGTLAAGPLKEEEGILYAEIDAGVARGARHEFDPVGHYARTDVFRLVVDTRPRPAVALVPGDAGTEPVGELLA